MDPFLLWLLEHVEGDTVLECACHPHAEGHIGKPFLLTGAIRESLGKERLFVAANTLYQYNR